MSRCFGRNHPSSFLIKDFECVADVFLWPFLIILPESQQEIINVKMQGFLISNSRGHKLHESGKVQSPFSISIHLPLPRNRSILICVIAVTFLICVIAVTICVIAVKSSTRLIISATSASVGIFPRERISFPSSEVEMAPSASLIKKVLRIKRPSFYKNEPLWRVGHIATGSNITCQRKQMPPLSHQLASHSTQGSLQLNCLP